MKSETSPDRNVLFICYSFPPVGGAGVQRSVKFVKYLPNEGWRPIVLTVQNPSVPVLDNTLFKDIPTGTQVLRSKTWEPSYRSKASFSTSVKKNNSFLSRWLKSVVLQWIQPDLQVLWNRSAYRTAVNALTQQKISAIYVSGPPFSSFLIGCKLKKRSGLPLVLDFRDEWSLSAKYLENQSRQYRTMSRQMRLFEETIKQADAIVATTQASADELRRCCLRVHAKASVECIYNGYDPSDFVELTEDKHDNQMYRLVYTGTLWRLTDISPLVKAIELWSRREPLLAKKLELILIGRRTPEQDSIVDRLEQTPITMRRIDYTPHDRSLQWAKNADGLLLLLAQESGAERVVPAKLFEYLALQLPILGIVPNGESKQLLDRCTKATAIHPNDSAEIENWLSNAIASKQPIRSKRIELHSGQLTAFATELQWCSRQFLTRQLAKTLDRIQCQSIPIGDM